MTPVIPYLRLRCTLRAAARCRLPPFKGSLLRGAFGHALRRAVCLLGPDLEGDLAPFAAPLRTAEILHVGKGATFGLGQLRVETSG